MMDEDAQQEELLQLHTDYVKGRASKAVLEHLITSRPEFKSALVIALADKEAPTSPEAIVKGVMDAFLKDMNVAVTLRPNGSANSGAVPTSTGGGEDVASVPYASLLTGATADNIDDFYSFDVVATPSTGEDAGQLEIVDGTSQFSTKLDAGTTDVLELLSDMNDQEKSHAVAFTNGLNRRFLDESQSVDLMSDCATQISSATGINRDMVAEAIEIAVTKGVTSGVDFAFNRALSGTGSPDDQLSTAAHSELAIQGGFVDPRNRLVIDAERATLLLSMTQAIADGRITNIENEEQLAKQIRMILPEVHEYRNERRAIISPLGPDGAIVVRTKPGMNGRGMFEITNPSAISTIRGWYTGASTLPVVVDRTKLRAGAATPRQPNSNQGSVSYMPDAGSMMRPDPIKPAGMPSHFNPGF